ncbi:MAG: hypothetical protein JWO87_177 [Phycisphaerales bacterium]|nr:hypothetical protein [Phycisphaerales bacterium]
MANNNITDTHPDFLSPLAATILRARPDAYQQLVFRGPTPPEATQLLGGVKPEHLLQVPVQAREEAAAMLGGLWLRHDALHECHELVQDLIGPTGAFWHAIMHRREGDFPNAKYWYARCADHRAMRLISAMSLDVVGRDTTDATLLHAVSGEYTPEAFVDIVQEVHKTPEDPRYAAAVRLQQIEWEALFHHCAYEAAGAAGGMI